MALFLYLFNPPWTVYIYISAVHKKGHRIYWPYIENQIYMHKTNKYCETNVNTRVNIRLVMCFVLKKGIYNLYAVLFALYLAEYNKTNSFPSMCVFFYEHTTGFCCLTKHYVYLYTGLSHSPTHRTTIKFTLAAQLLPVLV